MSLNPSPEETPGLRRRFIISSLIVVSIFSVLALRLWHLQILGVDHYRELSERNRIRYVAIQAPRGTIFDRYGNLLVDNRPAFTVSVLRQEVGDRERVFAALGDLLDVDVEQLEERWRAGQGLPRYQPLPLLEDIGRQAMEKVQENSVNLPGILVEVKPLRAYPYGEMAAHLFGYLGEVSEQELKRSGFAGYRSGEMVGKTALERMFEDRLRGAAGQKRIEVNVKGRELRQVTTRNPLPGRRLYLTIDATLQQAAETALADNAGAIVALDVNNGEVLAFVSRPTFDPAWFARGVKSEEWRDLIDNPRHPMTNKVLRGQYPPGSTFKMAVALAALETGTVTPATRVQCNGSFKLGSYEYRCWKKRGHGSVDLHKAIKESCDVWFYTVGLETGIDRIASAAQRLGLGKQTGFPFGKERSGLIPTRAWKKKRFGTSWYNGETVISSIGQGFVLTTPLQLASMAAALANGGTVWRPQVVQKIVDLAGGTDWILKPEKLTETAWPEESLRAVQGAMESVVNDVGGTAWRSRLKNVRFAGKTGTAQVIKRKSDEEEEKETKDDVIPYQNRDHALFVSYAPVDNPQISVAVVVEHGGHGSSAAAPIAKAMYEAYFADKNDEKDAVRQAASED
jgi:penicillin-binding protein 2